MKNHLKKKLKKKYKDIPESNLENIIYQSISSVLYHEDNNQLTSEIYAKILIIAKSLAKQYMRQSQRRGNRYSGNKWQRYRPR